MKKLLFLILLSPTLLLSQTIKDVTINDYTTQAYRLDETQKNKLIQTKYTKDKKKNAILGQELVDSYTQLEAALDNLDVKSAQEILKMIDFRLGSDAPNMKYLREEYNTYQASIRSENNKKERSLRESKRKVIQNQQIQTSSKIIIDSLDYHLTTDTSIKFPHHNYGAKYVGNGFNRVVDRLEGYITDKMKYSRIGEMQNDAKGNLINSFQNNGINRDKAEIKVKYYLKAPFKSDLTITKIEIIGSWEPIVHLFCFYWPTSINFEDKTKGAIATCRYSTDYIKIISDYPNARLEITNYE